MLTYLLWSTITDKKDLAEYILPMAMSLFSILIDILLIPLEIITLIVWKVRNR